MFDKTVVALGQRGETHHHHTTVVDPSVEKAARFLDEVQEKALSRIVGAWLVELPAVNVQAIRYDLAADFVTPSLRHRVAFKIGGKTVDFAMKTGEGDDPEAIAKGVVDKIAEQIWLQAGAPVVARILRSNKFV